jgi:hypothetical protein
MHMLCMRDNRSTGLRLLLWALPGAHSSFPTTCRQVTAIARALADEYKALLPAAAQPAGGEAEPAGSRHKALVFELNRSGKYAQMRDSLKTSVVSRLGM